MGLRESVLWYTGVRKGLHGELASVRAKWDNHFSFCSVPFLQPTSPSLHAQPQVSGDSQELATRDLPYTSSEVAHFHWGVEQEGGSPQWGILSPQGPPPHGKRGAQGRLAGRAAGRSGGGARTQEGGCGAGPGRSGGGARGQRRRGLGGARAKPGCAEPAWVGGGAGCARRGRRQRKDEARRGRCAQVSLPHPPLAAQLGLPLTGVRYQALPSSSLGHCPPPALRGRAMCRRGKSE
jgi:hypothetical protein